MQAEACLKAYLNQSEHYKLLAANIQIHTIPFKNKKEKLTLGELDYIVKNCKSKQIIHIELACKFYLYDETIVGTEEEKWIGPNRKDSLFDKLEKLSLKQFPLLTKAETIHKLETLEIPKPSAQELCLKAFLFLPKQLAIESFPKVFQDCIVGHYIKPEHLNEDPTALYAIPTKKEWLLPLEKLTTWHRFSEIKPLINEQLELKKSPLVYKKTPRNTECFFVVWW